MRKEDIRWVKNEWIGEKVVELCNRFYKNWNEQDKQEAYRTYNVLKAIGILLFIALGMVFILYFVVVGALIPLGQGIIEHTYECLIIIAVIGIVTILFCLFYHTGFYSISIHKERMKKERKPRKRRGRKT